MSVFVRTGFKIRSVRFPTQNSMCLAFSLTAEQLPIMWEQMDYQSPEIFSDNLPSFYYHPYSQQLMAAYPVLRLIEFLTLAVHVQIKG